MTESGGQAMERVRWRVLPAWAVVVLSAVAFWIVGFLPWVTSGLHLDVSSAWPNHDTVDTPRVALPFGEYQFPALFVGGVIGGAAALGVSRLAGPGVARPRLLAAAGATLALAGALAQTLLTVSSALAAMAEARVLVVALVVAAVASAFFGVLVGAGVAGGRGWPWLLGGAMVASVLGLWVVDTVNPPSGSGQLLGDAVARVHPWISGLALAVVLAIFGWRPATRLLGWLVAVAIAWVTPVLLSLLAYVTYAVSRGPLRQNTFPDLLATVRRDFLHSLIPTSRVVGPLVLAVVIGAVLATSLRARGPATPGDRPS